MYCIEGGLGERVGREEEREWIKGCGNLGLDVCNTNTDNCLI